MISIRQAKPEEYAQMKALWQLSFGDSPAFIDGFFERVQPEGLLVLLDDDVLCSMTAVLRNEVVTPDGDRWKSGYTYGLATQPDGRGKGYGSLLLQYVDSWLQRRGCACITTVPATPELYSFFARLGFLPAFSLHEQVFSFDTLPKPANGRWAVLSAQQYAEKRELLLNQSQGYVSCRGEIAALQQWMSQSSGGNLYELVIDDVCGVAAVELLPDGTLFAKEILMDQNSIRNAVALLSSIIPATLYRVRCPFSHNYHISQNFGMLKSYSKSLEKSLIICQYNYFGLGLD